MAIHTYELRWAPEGKVIGTVKATSASAARSQAPMPYRQFKGEIGVTVLDPSSFIGVIVAEHGHILLGGTVRHSSIPLQTEQMAREWIATARQINEQAGRKVRTWEVIPSDKKPQVTAQEVK